MRKPRFLFVSFTILLTVGSIAFFIWQKPNVRQDVFTFSYGEQVPYDSSTYLQYGWNHKDITFDKEQFSMRELGTYETEVSYEGKTYVLHIQIVDQEAPVITFAKDKNVTVYRQAGTLLLDSLFKIDDLSETTYELTPKIQDLQAGTQKICVRASDIYKNSSEACKEITLEIMDYEESTIAVQEESVEAFISKYIKAYNLNEQNFSFFYYSPKDDEEYIYNPDTSFNAASTIKVPLNMLYEDLKKEGKFHEETTFTLQASDIESGDGYTTIDYKIKEAIPLSYLQEQSICYSDNTATNILIRGLGGFTKYRGMLPKYSDEILPASFYKANETSAAYMLDVMKYLYEHRSEYATLLENMEHASEDMFLQESTDVFSIAQKYGEFDTYLHTIGIVYTPKPYIVGIYTDDVEDAYQLIVEINKGLIAYQLNKKD